MPMKRWLVLFLLGLLLAGCGAAGQASENGKLILRYAENQSEDYPTTKAAHYFAQLVQERTHGKIVIRVYPDGALGDESSVLEQVQYGGIDFTRVSVAAAVEYCPKMEVLSLPFLYDDAAHMWRVLDGKIGDDFLLATRSMGVVGLSWYDAGARSFYSRKPIASLADLQGMRIRVQESAVMERTVELLGAIPVQMPYGDVYSGMITGKVDGAENNLPSYISASHCEAAPFFFRDQHSRLPEMQIMSTAAMDQIAQMDEDYVTIVLSCAKESAKYERQLWSEQVLEAQKAAADHGCTITEINESQITQFREAVQPIYDDLSEENRALAAQIRRQ